MSAALALEGLRCPTCRAAELAPDGSGIRCGSCATGYAVEEGVPVLLPDTSATASEAERRHKESQRQFFDEEEDPVWELSRPHGAPALYGRLMLEKLERSLSGLEALVPGSRILTVCGGSGMEAEFLCRAGAAEVVVCDLSVGAVLRAQERARRAGLPIRCVAGDVEALPFADGAFDGVYVHDGLHHLEDPLLGLREMARVADRFVSVTEPADAFATAIAVRLRIALEEEEAGNRVERLSPGVVLGELESAGFAAARAQRYAMFYRHAPGPAMRLLSRRRLLPAGTALWRAANALTARGGNKLSVTAVRSRPA